jgi:serine/threonine protein kinase
MEDIAEVAQGVIKLATHDPSGEKRCVKCFDKAKLQPEAFELLITEIEIMFDLGRHPNLGGALETFQDAGFYHVVQPYYPGGNLVGLKGRAKKEGVIASGEWWKNIFHQCLCGIEHMHAHDVLHCDIKEANIMMKAEDLSKPEVVIIDFGVAQRAGTSRNVIYGTPGYIPPEVWESKNWVPQSDMFSFGVVLVQMLIGKTGIFTENTRTYKEMMEATKCRLPPFELMPLEWPSLQRLAEQLLSKDLQARPTAATVLHSMWDDIVAESAAGSTPSAARLRRRHTFASESSLISCLDEIDDIAQSFPLSPKYHSEVNVDKESSGSKHVPASPSASVSTPKLQRASTFHTSFTPRTVEVDIKDHHKMLAGLSGTYSAAVHEEPKVYSPTVRRSHSISSSCIHDAAFHADEDSAHKTHKKPLLDLGKPTLSPTRQKSRLMAGNEGMTPKAQRDAYCSGKSCAGQSNPNANAPVWPGSASVPPARNFARRVSFF